MRDCGKCTWCCYFVSAPELHKATNEYCRYCIADVGCSKYEDRPSVCRSFGCLWWHQVQIPESLRPDKCGVMFELPNNCHTYIGYPNPKNPDMWKTSNVRTLIQKIVEAGDSVLIYNSKNGRKHYFLPKGITKEDVSRDLFLSHLQYRLRWSGENGSTIVHI